MLRMSANGGYEPVTVCALALKLLWMRTSVWSELRAGSIRSRETLPAALAMSVSSNSIRRPARVPPACRLVRPAKMIIRSRPKFCETLAWPTRRPSPAATISTIEMTPQAMPNMVSAVRSLCAQSVWNTSRMRSRRTMSE